LQYEPSTNASGFKADPDGGDALIDLTYTLNPAYRANARWVMNRATVAIVRKMKDSNGHYIWQPGLQAGQPAMILGYPTTEAEDMSDVAANAFPIAFGDFREGYTIVERQGIRVLRDPFSAKPFVQFYTTKRVGGDVTNFDAIKLFKIAAS
jgi:HK97 family phage major capsid protein